MENFQVITDVQQECQFYIPAMVHEISEREDKNHNIFCVLDLVDKNLNKFNALMFKTTKEDLANMDIDKGVFYNFYLYSSFYNNKLSFKVNEIGETLDNIEVSIDANAEKSNYYFNEIIKLASSAASPLSDIALKLLNDNKESILIWTAGKSMHHTKPGDWLEHTYFVIKNAVAIGEIYNANKDILIVSAALHDIGKLDELNVDKFGMTDYTVDGQLFGHSCIGAYKVMETANELGVSGESVKLLVHMLLAHHGRRKFEAADIPATKEAFILAQADAIDSRMWMINDAYTKMDSGTTDRIYGIDEDKMSSIYKPLTENGC